ncbi:MAG: VWA domain-containing protein, partial [Solirubrobacteraceae bacterium]
PIAAAAHGRIRAAGLARLLGLRAPPPWSLGWRSATVAAALALLGLAAAQPALTDQTATRTRTDAAVLFVVDTSRSMAASRTPSSPTRLARALEAAVRLRAAIPEVPAGLATLTDRVLPDLLPVPGAAGFDATADRAVTIEQPPPVGQAARITSYAALADIAGGNYFDPHVRRRLIVLLSDGESNPFDPAALSHELAFSDGYRFVAIRFWDAQEQVFDADGKAEPGYHPDPAGRALLTGLASALDGRFFEESDAGGAASYLREILGRGPTAHPKVSLGERALAPYVAGVALALLLVALLPLGLMRRRILASRR